MLVQEMGYMQNRSIYLFTRPFSRWTPFDFFNILNFDYLRVLKLFESTPKINVSDYLVWYVKHNEVVDVVIEEF